MLQVGLRKLALLLILVPLLHAAGFYYALKFRPVIVYSGGAVTRTTAGATVDGEVFEIAEPSFGERYRDYWRAAVQGDLGKIDRTQVAKLLPRFIQRSLLLAGVALGATLLLGPLLGLLAISPRTGRISPAALSVFTLGTAVPGFFLGTTLMVGLLAVTRRGWFGMDELPFPVLGYGADKHLILPTLALIARPVMYVGYVTAGMLEGEFQQDYIRVARSKGLRWSAIVRRHALPNIAAPVVASLGRALQMVVGGLLLVETLFDWRGAGWLLGQSIAGGYNNPYYFNPGLVGLLLAFLAAQLILLDGIFGLGALASDPRLRQGRQSTAGH